ncbi:MAG: hypothetical protein ABSA17_08700 [Rhabdochlamydiaceae bacterium]
MQIDSVSTYVSNIISNISVRRVADAVWYAADNRVVQIVKNNPLHFAMFFAASSLWGIATASIVECFPSNKENIRKLLNSYSLASQFTIAAGFFVACHFTLSLKNNNRKILGLALVYSTMVSGFLLGMKITEYFNNTYHKVDGELNLQQSKLTDTDLRWMAESGRFRDVVKLDISGNPKITGQGLEWIGRRGFENLKVLKIACNTSIFGDTAWWKGNFNGLELLDLTHTDISETILENMINDAEWVRKLKMIYLFHNDCLKNLPANILRLTNLDQKSMTGGPVTKENHYGAGLLWGYQDSSLKKIYTKEVLILLKEGKLFINSNMEGKRRLFTLEQLFEKNKIPRE